MKYAFFVLASSLFFSSALQARTITSFNDSPALMSIAQFMIDNAEDMIASHRISDKKLKVKDPSLCEVVSPSLVLSEVQSAINSILRMFPDEELPIEEAMSDLADYIGPGPLKKCHVTQTNSQKKILVSYFFDGSDKVHVKVDTITLHSL